MEGILLTAALLACPPDDVVHEQGQPQARRPQPAANAQELRAEHARLTAEIERRERAETGIAAAQRAS